MRNTGIIKFIEITNRAKFHYQMSILNFSNTYQHQHFIICQGLLNINSIQKCARYTTILQIHTPASSSNSGKVKMLWFLANEIAKLSEINQLRNHVQNSTEETPCETRPNSRKYYHMLRYLMILKNLFQLPVTRNTSMKYQKVIIIF